MTKSADGQSRNLKAVRTSGRLVDQAHEILRTAIISWKIKPGERLYQEALAREIGVSQMVVREVMSRLEAEGLVITQPYKGTRATPHTYQDLKDLYQIRVLLEGIAVELAADLLTEQELVRMQILLPGTTYNPKEPETLIDTRQSHRAFHMIAIQASHQKYLVRFIDQIWNLIDPYLIYSPALIRYLSEEQVEVSIQEDRDLHTQFLMALKERDKKRARELNDYHLLDGLRCLEDPMTLALQQLGAAFET